MGTTPPDLTDTTTTVPPGALNPYYRNPRRGDIPAIKRSLFKLAQYKPITVNIGTHTGRPNEVLAGNHTLAAIRELHDEHPDDPAWQAVKVHWGDWDEDDCRLINAADNRTAELGGYDTAELVALLDAIPDTDLAAVGYSPDDLADLRAALEEGSALDEGLIDGKDLADTGASYADRLNTRMMVLTFSIPLFVWVQTHMEAYRAQHGLNTNAGVVAALLAQWSGQEPPEPELIETP